MSVARLLFLAFSMLCSACLRPTAMAQQLQAELAQESAWTGQPIRLNIKLLSPGPFSGTAAFDLPQLDRVIIQKIGRPIVGSEQFDGETQLTQLHEFHVFSQRTGSIEIPPFRVRYSARQDFTSKAEPHQNETPALQFASKRPPGTESLGLVVATKNLRAKQDWSPDRIDELTAGDVITRSVQQLASDTTAMILPTIPTTAIDGIRTYTDRPVVTDQTERGEATATRTDTIKYQFERVGTYQIPDVTVRWWNTQSEQLVQQILPGKTITVAGSIATDDLAASASNLAPSTGEVSPWWILIGTLVLSGLAFGGYMTWKRWQEHLQCEPTKTSRNLIAACDQNDAMSAYQLLQRWKLLVHLSDEQLAGLSSPEQELAQSLYDPHAEQKRWDGNALQHAIIAAQQAPARQANNDQPLPPLNPSQPVGR